MFNRGIKQFWRPLIGVVVAYAVAAQSLLIALGGFSLPAHADVAVPGFELCLHDSQGAPALPAEAPAHPGCSHCIFCFVGSHHALIGSPPVLFSRVDVAVIDAPWVADKHSLPRLSAYSIASPRGPPLRA
ncbi:MAG: hypothetical protein ABSA68_18290 [Xanthobacteraceae bacterium]|jgi:hypothetical protein